MYVRFYKRDDYTIAKLYGELDHHNASKVREKIDFEVIRSSCRNLIIDFSEVAFMDSSGIGVVIGRYKNIREINGKIYLANLSQRVRKIFEMCGVLNLIPELENYDDQNMLAGGVI